VIAVPRLLGCVLAGAVVLALLTGVGAEVADAAPADAGCTTPKTTFKPTKAAIPGVVGVRTVITVRRTRSGAIGTPPISTRGKKVFGRDAETRAGDRHHTVIMDAHTWPDGSALGNALLKRLHSGAAIRLTRGKGHLACYRVTKRTSYPRSKLPMARIYSGEGRLAIIVCSGKRISAGNWTRRTVWFATLIETA
jgi:hypothetical protein